MLTAAKAILDFDVSLIFGYHAQSLSACIESDSIAVAADTLRKPHAYAGKACQKRRLLARIDVLQSEADSFLANVDPEVLDAATNRANQPQATPQAQPPGSHVSAPAASVMVPEPADSSSLPEITGVHLKETKAHPVQSTPLKPQPAPQKTHWETVRDAKLQSSSPPPFPDQRKNLTPGDSNSAQAAQGLNTWRPRRRVPGISQVPISARLHDDDDKEADAEGGGEDQSNDDMKLVAAAVDKVRWYTPWHALSVEELQARVHFWCTYAITGPRKRGGRSQAQRRLESSSTETVDKDLRFHVLSRTKPKQQLLVGVELEASGLQWIWLAAKHYLEGACVFFITDHEPLGPAMTAVNRTEYSPRIEAIRASLMPYLHNFTFIHRPGSTHTNADVTDRMEW